MKHILLTLALTLCVTLCPAQSKKELKQKAKTEALAMKALEDKAAQMESDGWKVKGSTATILDILTQQRDKQHEMMAAGNGESTRRFIVSEGEESAPSFDKALKTCQAKVRRDIIAEMCTSVETVTVTNTHTQTDFDGTTETSSRSKTHTSQQSSANTADVQELARLFRKTSTGYDVRIIMFIDLKKE